MSIRTLGVLGLLAISPAFAATPINETRPLAADGSQGVSVAERATQRDPEVKLRETARVRPARRKRRVTKQSAGEEDQHVRPQHVPQRRTEDRPGDRNERKQNQQNNRDYGGKNPR